VYKKGKPRLVSIDMLKEFRGDNTVCMGLIVDEIVSVFDIDNEELYLD